MSTIQRYRGRHERPSRLREGLADVYVTAVATLYALPFALGDRAAIRRALGTAGLGLLTLGLGLTAAVLLLGRPTATVRPTVPTGTYGPGVLLCTDSHVRVLPCR